MSQETRKNIKRKYSPPPTVKHDSSANNAQDYFNSGLFPPDKESFSSRSHRRHSGSDGTAKAGRGSNH